LWPAAWAVSNYLLTEPDFRGNLSSLSILELGTGTGLVSIAAAMGGAKRVIATDYEPLALDLTRYAADNLNKNLSSNNNVSLSETIETSLLDLCDLKEQPLPIEPQEASSKFVVVAADIMVNLFPKHGVFKFAAVSPKILLNSSEPF
jgi:predicted nicotinamide N-methyase